MSATERAAVVAEARTWLGTPFHHMARLKGVGVDCIQLVAGVFGAAGAIETPPVEREFYPNDWFLHQDRDRLIEAIEPHFAELPAGAALLPGDLMLFRFGRCVSHVAIVLEVAPEILVAHSFRGSGVSIDEVSEHHYLWVRRAGVRRLRRWLTLTGS